MNTGFLPSGFRNDFDVRVAIAENHRIFEPDFTGVPTIVAANVKVDFNPLRKDYGNFVRSQKLL
jgi:hypothetical protein